LPLMATGNSTIERQRPEPVKGGAHLAHTRMRPLEGPSRRHPDTLQALHGPSLLALAHPWLPRRLRRAQMRQSYLPYQEAVIAHDRHGRQTRIRPARRTGTLRPKSAAGAPTISQPPSIHPARFPNYPEFRIPWPDVPQPRRNSERIDPADSDAQRRPSRTTSDRLQKCPGQRITSTMSVERIHQEFGGHKIS
jgi:hypothetical protein